MASEQQTAALMRTLYRVVLAERRAGRTVHLCIAGGRKTMAAYGMVVAQLLFPDNHHVWHLYSENWRPGNQRVMPARPGDSVSHLPVPILRWSSVFSGLMEAAGLFSYRFRPDMGRGARRAAPKRFQQGYNEHWSGGRFACNRLFARSAACKGSA